jgi:bacillithiol synthase
MPMVESQILEYQRVPFASIPHTSRLFEDYLHHFDRVSKFYARPPLARDWWPEEIKKIQYPTDRRQAVAAVLERQNREFGAGEKTLANIQRLREGAPAVVTGQQVGLFGGALLVMLKAITAVKLAEESGAVPIFWMATEDHDFAEVSGVNLPAAERLQKISVNVDHAEGAPVGTISFSDEITAAVHQVEGLFGSSDAIDALAAGYRKGENFGSAFAKFYSRIFADLGIIILNPLDAELHKIAQPVFRGALEKSAIINQALQTRTQELEAAGYAAQVKVTPSHTLCFYLENGVRTSIRDSGDAFLIGERKLSPAEMLGETERCPELFSANVLLRPIMQDHLLPTLCYIGGPAEVSYFAQIETVYRNLSSHVTPILPRIFATLIEPRQAKLLERYGLALTDVFVAPEKLREVVAARALPADAMRGLDEAAEHLDQALGAMKKSLEVLDRTLLDAAENAASKMRYQLQGLRDKAARAEARKNSELHRHADELSVLLYPEKELQEREVGAVYFLLKYGVGVVEKIKATADAHCGAHQVIPLQAF